MARPPLEFFDTEKIPWEPHVVQSKRMDPLMQKVLSYDEETGAITLFVKYPTAPASSMLRICSLSS